jgi:hypothetical protein
VSVRPQSAIRRLRRDVGMLEYEAHLGSTARGVWLTTDEPVLPRADAALAATVIPAMVAAGGSELHVPGPVSPRLLAGCERVQEIFSGWSQDWTLEPMRSLTPVTIVPDEVRPGDVPPGDRVAAFFSGGVDSFATILAHPDITDLIYAAGLDTELTEQRRIAEIDAHLRTGARELGKRFIRVDTNIRVLTNPLMEWRVVFGSVLGAITLLLAGALRKVYIAGYGAEKDFYPNGSHALTDPLWAAEGMEIVHDGGVHARAAQIARIADHPVVRKRLRVCWQTGEGLNCGVCEKCLGTMASLATLGVLDRFETFPALDLDRLSAVEVDHPDQDHFWRSYLHLARERDAPRELIAALESALASIDRRDDSDIRRRG